jgi:hypothetical protein
VRANRQDELADFKQQISLPISKAGFPCSTIKPNRGIGAGNPKSL